MIRIMVTVHDAATGQHIMDEQQFERRGVVNVISRELRDADADHDFEILTDFCRMRWSPGPGWRHLIPCVVGSWHVGNSVQPLV